MHLKHLELYGFKSFADRTEMAFGKGITGIVGPNGSGKSNIADAVRWVLGEQSAKALRGGKMEDVIFAGTQSRKQLAYSKVALTFDNQSRMLPVDYAEVTVTRRVFRNGESEYLLNDTPCRLKDIIDMLRDTGIGKEGYSLIGQGRIDEILSVRPEDRRAVFEEAAGIVKTKTRKLEAEKRLGAASANLVRIEDLLQDLTDQIEPLRAQADKAQAWLKLREELRDIDINLFLREHEAWEGRVAQLGGQIAQMETERASLRAQLEEMGASRESAHLEGERVSRHLAEAREALLAGTRSAEAAEGRLAVLRERVIVLEREIARVTGDRTAADQSLSGTRAAIEAQIQAESGKREQLAILAERKRVAECEINRLAASEAEAEELLDSAKTARLNAINRASDAKAAEARLLAIREQLSRSLADAQANAVALREGLPARIDDARDAEEKLTRSALALDSIRQELAGAQKQSDEEAKRIAELDDLARNLEGKERELKSRLKMLEEMARDYEGYGQSVKAVMREAEKRGDAGVRGVVATLMEVPRELERAIEMSLGGQMQNIVVNREEDAKAMIEFLRTARLGRATFLPLCAMRPRLLSPAERACLTLPGCVGIASELVSYAPEFRPVMESLLGRTVVARDLDSGIAIMRKGQHAFRLVTLEGDVMHSGGSMTGGSVQSRMTSLLSREREIAEHSGACAENAAQRAKAAQEIALAREKRVMTKERLVELYESERQADILLTRDTQSLALLRERKDEYELKITDAENGLAQVADSIADIDAELTKRKTETSDVALSEEEWARDIEAKQETARRTRAALEQARTEHASLSVDLATAEHELSSLARELARLRDESVRGEGHTERMLNEQQRLEGERVHTDAELTGATTELAQVKGHLEVVRVRAAELETGFEELGARERDLSEAIEKLHARVESSGEGIHRAQLALERVESDKKALIERVWNEYELTFGNARTFFREDFEEKGAKKRVEEIRAQVRALGPVNVHAIDEHQRVFDRFELLKTQRDDVICARNDLEKIIAELVRHMEMQFKEQFALLNGHFGRVFSVLFGGGTAELVLQDERDVLNCGIDVVAQPPGKKLQMLSLLSGGERALTAIAILFAMLSIKPTPFCILDEIEAALDDANIEHFADFLAQFSLTTQFIVVTHRKPTMERCDVLYGIAMEEKGVSRMVSVRLTDQKEA